MDVEKVGYFIPFSKSINRLLELPEVWQSVLSPQLSTNDFMYDICDGDFIRNSPFFQQNPKAIQAVLNTDDVEIVNPVLPLELLQTANPLI